MLIEAQIIIQRRRRIFFLIYTKLSILCRQISNINKQKVFRYKNSVLLVCIVLYTTTVFCWYVEMWSTDSPKYQWNVDVFFFFFISYCSLCVLCFLLTFRERLFQLPLILTTYIYIDRRNRLFYGFSCFDSIVLKLIITMVKSSPFLLF